MILGRPTNLWLGLAAALVGFLSVSAVAIGVDPALVASIAGAGTGLLGSMIALVAFQPPTLSPGDTYTIQTPGTQPNYQTTVAKPPAQDPPPEPTPKG